MKTILLYLTLASSLLVTALATTYIWGVPRKVVTIDDGIDEIVQGPPPGTPKPGTPKPGTPKPPKSTPKPGTPKPAAPSHSQIEAALAVNAYYSQWASQDPATAMRAALYLPKKSAAMRVAQVWAQKDPAEFSRWYALLEDTPAGRELRKRISLALPASQWIDPENYRDHPDLPQIAQTWAVFTSERHPERVRQFAESVEEPLRGLLLEISQKVP